MCFAVMFFGIFSQCEFGRYDFNIMNPHSPSLLNEEINLFEMEEAFFNHYRAILELAKDIDAHKSELESHVDSAFALYTQFSKSRTTYVDEGQLGYVTANSKFHEMSLRLASVFELLHDPANAEVIFDLDATFFKDTTYIFKHALQRSRFLQKCGEAAKAQNVLERACNVPFFQDRVYWPVQSLYERMDVLGALARSYHLAGRIQDAYETYFELFTLVHENKTSLPNICQFWSDLNYLDMSHPDQMPAELQTLMGLLEQSLFLGFREAGLDLDCHELLQANADHLNLADQRAGLLPDAHVLVMELNCHNLEQLKANVEEFKLARDARR